MALEVSEARPLKELKDENRRLKHMVAYLSLDKEYASGEHHLARDERSPILATFRRGKKPSATPGAGDRETTTERADGARLLSPARDQRI
jgi:hypothetical protein